MINKITILLVLLFCINSQAQNAFIISKKGEKIIIRDNAIDLDQGEIISYKLVGKTWEKYITYKDLDYLSFGKSIFKTFIVKKDNKKQKEDAFFVIAKNEGKTLLCKAIEIKSSTGATSFSGFWVRYNLLIVDNDNNIVEMLDFDSRLSEKQQLERIKAAPMVKKYFSNCNVLMNYLNKFVTNDEMNLKILEFFDNTEYIECN